MFSVLFFRSNEMQPRKNTSCSTNQFSAAKFKSMQYTERGSFSSLAEKVSESLTAADLWPAMTTVGSTLSLVQARIMKHGIAKNMVDLQQPNIPYYTKAYQIKYQRKYKED